MKRGGPLKRWTPLLRTGFRRRRSGRRTGGPLAEWCEARIAYVCSGRAQHRHHLRLRSQGGNDGPTLDVCFSCHRRIHDQPKWSYEHGFLLRREA